MKKKIGKVDNNKSNKTKSTEQTRENNVIMIISDSESSSDEENVLDLSLSNAKANEVVIFEQSTATPVTISDHDRTKNILPMEVKVDGQRFKLSDSGNVELLSLNPLPKLRYNVEPANLVPNEEFYHRCIEYKKVGKIRYYLLQKSGRRFIRFDMPEEHWKINRTILFTLKEDVYSGVPTRYLLDMMYTIAHYILMNMLYCDLYVESRYKFEKTHKEVIKLGEKLWHKYKAKKIENKRCPVLESCEELSKTALRDDVFYHAFEHLDVLLKCNVKDKNGNKIECGRRRSKKGTESLLRFRRHLRRHDNNYNSGHIPQYINDCSDFYGLGAEMEKLVEQFKKDLREKKKVEVCQQVDEAGITENFVKCSR